MTRALLAACGKYTSVGKMSFLRFTAYKADIIIHFLTYPIVFVAFFFFISGVFSGRLGQTGYTVSQLLAYYSVGWMLRMINHHGADISIGQSILTGDIASLLVKPVDHHYYSLAEALGKAFGRILLYSLPAFLILSFFVKQFAFVWNAGLIRFLALSLVGFFISFEVQYLIGCAAFFFTVNHQIVWITDMTIRLISGLVIPLSFFPHSVSRLLELLPFQYIYYIPIQAWIGKVDAHGFNMFFLTGLAWLAVLYLLGRGICLLGLKRFTVFGG